MSCTRRWSNSVFSGVFIRCFIIVTDTRHHNTTFRKLFPPSSEATLTAELICFVVSVTSPGIDNSWFPKGRVVVLYVCDKCKGPDKYN